MINAKPYDLLAYGFSVTFPKVPEHDLCKGLRIAAQHVTNHEIIDQAELSLKEQVIAQSKEIIHSHQMGNVPHASPMIPMRASVK